MAKPRRLRGGIGWPRRFLRFVWPADCWKGHWGGEPLLLRRHGGSRDLLRPVHRREPADRRYRRDDARLYGPMAYEAVGMAIAGTIPRLRGWRMMESRTDSTCRRSDWVRPHAGD